MLVRDVRVLSRAAVAVGVVALGLTACSGGATSSGDERRVGLKLLAFSPPSLTVGSGTTVTWRSEEAVTHTVTSGVVNGIDITTGLRTGETPDGLFDGRLETAGATFAYRFVDAGAYGYFCTIHQGMNATVVVAP